MVRPRNGLFQADVNIGTTRSRKSFNTKLEAQAWEAAKLMEVA